jgi:hypothetical protein
LRADGGEGAVYVGSGTPCFSGCTFTGNTAGALLCDVDIDEWTCANISADDGGAVLVGTGTTVFSHCTFIGNTAGAYFCHLDIGGRVLTVEETLGALSMSAMTLQDF